MDVARVIRHDLKNHTIKILLLASIGELRPSERTASGIDATMSKPVKQSTLLDNLVQLLNMEAVSVDAPPELKSVSEADSSSGTVHNDTPVLLVEDNIVNQLLAVKILEAEGYPVDVAENGQKAVDMIQKNKYALILMDMQMPVMDGLEASRTIRAWEQTQKRSPVPIIALTAHAVEGYKEVCIENGLDDYMTKPMRRDLLLDMIEEWAKKDV